MQINHFFFKFLFVIWSLILIASLIYSELSKINKKLRKKKENEIEKFFNSKDSDYMKKSFKKIRKWLNDDSLFLSFYNNFVEYRNLNDAYFTRCMRIIYRDQIQKTGHGDEVRKGLLNMIKEKCR